MKSVGVRKLKAHLSQILREVQDGEIVLVTDRGRVVAELKSPTPSSSSLTETDRALARLAAAGEMRLAERPMFSYSVSPISLPDGTAQELLDETRGER
ncbi:MAG: type II toxin-antitoxin system prevent-host-death family antitoxin [Gemmatimonadaceae bacterium]|nr:type II toxin-antitoxin system prevent-host-death family antitoxin [Gemmatimonadaceae bacterium]